MPCSCPPVSSSLRFIICFYRREVQNTRNTNTIRRLYKYEKNRSRHLYFIRHLLALRSPNPNTRSGTRIGPGGGLFPAVAGFLLIICGTIVLVRIHKDNSDTFFINKKACLAFAATFATVFSVKFLGMAGALFLFLFCWIHFVEKQKALSSFLLSFGTSGGLWLVFSFFLNIPLPMGLLG